MPCGVETTRQIVETLRQSSKPLTLIELSTMLGRTHSTIRDGINNILETGTPQMSVHPVRIPGRKGRPERAYLIQS